MTLLAFITAVLALLLAPGPTNTLIGVAGSQSGIVRAARLIPAELAGYLTTIMPLTLLGSRFFSDFPIAALLLKSAAAIWVMYLAIKLWGRAQETEGMSAVTVGKVYMTTALNPKALVVSFILLPPIGDSAFMMRLAVFCALVIGVASIWASTGNLLSGGKPGNRTRIVERVASVWLAAVSVMLIVTVLKS
ncbi:threonine/homoserine/homoserine lactone efflux protein [Rhizobium aquaticum]|uniref:Threonine/homoserine/homoserine lactone efflux protein n=1 Tax=Rhizobium aquaticum TaxID=1549636 RepID=A0ABV2IWH9_9HYPH